MFKARRPVIIVFLPYLAGLIFSHLFSLSKSSFQFTLFLSFLLIIAFLSLRYRRLVKAFLILIAFATGCFFSFIANDFIPGSCIANFVTSGEESILSGQVISIPENYQDKISFLLAADALEKNGKRYSVSGKVKVNIYGGSAEVGYGDKIKVLAKLFIPRGFRNPGGFDYQEFLETKGISLVGTVKSDLYIVSRLEKRGNLFLEWIYDWRKDLISNIEKNFVTPYSSMLVATLFGERSGLSDEIENKFKFSGTYHIFAISGFNIGLVSFIFYMLFRLIGLSPVFASFPAIIAVTFYSILAGMQPSVVRAMIMAIVYFISVIIKRESDLYNSLCIAAFLILIMDPNALFDVGFILTFAATFFIMYLTPKINELMKFIPSRYLSGLVSASLSAQIGVTPVLAFYFNNISLTAVLANLVVVPLASLIFGIGIVFLGFSLFFTSSLFYIAGILAFLLQTMLSSVDFFSRLPFAYIKIPTPNIFQVTSFYFLVFLIVYAKGRKPLRLVSIAFAVILAGSLFTGVSNIINSDKLKVTFLDVGEGDCALIILPGGKTVLIDGGGTYDDNFDTGEKVVTPFLLYNRITTLDYVILTHPHPDHMNGLKAVLKNFTVKNFWEGCADGSYDLNYRIIKDTVSREKIPYKKVGSGEEYSLDKDVIIRVINPTKEVCERKNDYFKNMNNLSLAFQVIYKKVKILFAGDIQIEAMKNIIERNADIRSTAIKVPHHGAKDSADFEFIKKVSPKVAVISAGANNRFHHPSAEALEIYKKSGAKIYRTDINGAVTLRSDGVRVWVETEENQK